MFSKLRMKGLLAVLLVATTAALLMGAGTTQLGQDGVVLFLKINGSAVQGEGAPSSLGRMDSIPLIAYVQAGFSPTDAASGQATGKRQYQPIRIRKAVDKSSPLIAAALAQNKNIDADFRFVRQSPSGDGTMEQFYTVQTSNGRITSMRTAFGENNQLIEEVEFNFASITWTISNGGISASDSPFAMP